MADNPPAPEAEFDWPPYPEFGTDADALARMKLFDWILAQLAEGKVRAEPGDHILATDGRILGVGPDSDELFRRVIEAEPALRHARIVEHTIPPRGW
jgi:hypothetical protein